MLSKPRVHSREIQLHPGEISLECAKRRDHLVKLLIMLILLAADRSQRVQDQLSPFVAHGFRFPVRPCYPIRCPGARQFVRCGYLDSSAENRRQKEFNNRRARFRRQGDRRSVEWLCRRDGRRLRACWPACNGCRGGGESGCWRGGRKAVCGRTERAGQPEPLLG